MSNMMQLINEIRIIISFTSRPAALGHYQPLKIHEYWLIERLELGV